MVCNKRKISCVQDILIKLKKFTNNAMIYAKKYNYQKMVKNIDNNTLKSYNKRFCAKFKISALMNAITLKKVSDI